jgi:hypothetical protein
MTTSADVAPNAEEIKTPAQQLRVGPNASLEINVELPPGYHLNPLAPQRYKVSVGDAKNITVEEKNAARGAKDLKLPLRIPLNVVSAGSFLLPRGQHRHLPYQNAYLASSCSGDGRCKRPNSNQSAGQIDRGLSPV